MKHTRHLITYTAPVDIHVIMLARMGLSTEGIANQTRLTPGQVQYRITKAHRLEKLDRQNYYRRGWRNGTSPLAQRVVRLVQVKTALEIRRTLAPKLIALPDAQA